MVVDSHCHLHLMNRKEREETISELHAKNLAAVLNVCTRLNDINEMLEISKSHCKIYSSVGIHPSEAEDEKNIPKLEDLLEFTKLDNIIGIGESGIDLYKYSKIDQQEESFRIHINAARISKLPIIIHARSADEHIIRIIKDEMLKNGPFKALIHCFSASREFAFQAIELDLYISFSGIITFARADLIREVAKYVPHDRILVETDSPYLAPEPYRGQKNKPIFVHKVVEKLSEVLDRSPEYIEALTTNNFFNLFSKANQ